MFGAGLMLGSRLFEPLRGLVWAAEEGEGKARAQNRSNCQYGNSIELMSRTKAEDVGEEILQKEVPSVAVKWMQLVN